MPSMTDNPIILKPLRMYPLPDKLRSLDNPWSDVEMARHVRVDLYREGYDTTSGDSPLIVNPNISKSNLLNKL